MVSCSGFGLPLHAQLLRLFVTRQWNDPKTAMFIFHALVLNVPYEEVCVPWGGSSPVLVSDYLCMLAIASLCNQAYRDTQWSGGRGVQRHAVVGRQRCTETRALNLQMHAQ